MGYGIGAGKYLIKGIFLNPIALYLYGGVILGFLELLSLLAQGISPEGFLVYAISTYLPPTSFLDAILQTLIGGLGATLSWLFAMAQNM